MFKTHDIFWLLHKNITYMYNYACISTYDIHELYENKRLYFVSKNVWHMQVYNLYEYCSYYSHHFFHHFSIQKVHFFAFISSGHFFTFLKYLLILITLMSVFPYSSGNLNGSLHHLLRGHHSFMSHHAEKQFSRYCHCSRQVTSPTLS